MADPVSQDATPSAARLIPNDESNTHKYIAGQSHAALQAARDELRRQLSASRQRLVEELREAQAAAKVRIARGSWFNYKKDLLCVILWSDKPNFASNILLDHCLLV